jgi:hypothetical protein
MKSILSAAVVIAAIAAYSTFNVQAKSISHLSSTTGVTAVSDTGKMSKMKTKKMSKMSKSKMSKDTTKKMSKM